MSIVCDGQFISKEIEELGNTVTLRTVSLAYDTTSYRVPTETTSDTSNLKAIVQVLTTADQLVKEGTFRAGDLVFYFKGSQTGLTPGNRISHNSVWYEINDTITHEVSDTVYVIEVRTRKC